MRRAAVAVLAVAIVAALGLVGCEAEKVADVPTLRALVREIDGDVVESLPVYADKILTKELFQLSTTELVEPLAVEAVEDPETGERFSAYKIKHDGREGWIPAAFLAR